MTLRRFSNHVRLDAQVRIVSDFVMTQLLILGPREALNYTAISMII